MISAKELVKNDSVGLEAHLIKLEKEIDRQLIDYKLLLGIGQDVRIFLPTSDQNLSNFLQKKYRDFGKYLICDYPRIYNSEFISWSVSLPQSLKWRFE